MSKTLITLAAAVAIVLAALQMDSVQARLVSWTLPDFPEWPAAMTQLDEHHLGTTYFASYSPFDLEVLLNGVEQSQPTTGLGFLSYPEGASIDQPVPAMVILPGSGGLQPGRESQYAQLLNDHGIAAFVVDYYRPRGITPDTHYVVKVSAVTEFDLITDAYAALQLLATSPLIDARRIGLMGFSYGGMATRLAMDARLQQALAPDTYPFALHVDFYGPCFQDLASPALTGAPLLTLRGTEDRSNDLDACRLRETELEALGASVTAQIYPGAGHAWENTQPRFLSDSPYLSGCVLRYDEQGRPWLNDERINDYGLTLNRSERIAARFGSADKFQDCLQHGYLIGGDERTKRQGYRALLAFLQQHFSL